MNATLKKLLTNTRIIILTIFLILCILAIHPNPDPEGITIRSVVENSSADLAGMKSPPENSAPMSRERVISIDNRKIETVEEYYDYVEALSPGRNIRVQTNKQTYSLYTKALTETHILPETETVMVNETYTENKTINGTIVEVNKTRIKIVTENKTETIELGLEDIGLKVYEAPTTNIIKGLDIAGGTRVLLRPEEELDADTTEVLVENMKQRLNIYGLSDILVKPTKDLSGNQFIIVEIAGANEDEVKNLISKQGKFEGKIGEEVIFTGGDRDITYVCRTAQCSGINPIVGCQPLQGGGYICGFRFSITLRPEAAQRMADITDKLEVLTTSEDGTPIPKDERYLSEPISLYLDGKEVDTLNIGASLKGTVTTDIQISGSGVGNTEHEAAQDSLSNMKTLQTVLITGSLPTTMQIEKIDNLSPVLGEEFLNNAILIGFTSILAVALVVFIRFRKWYVTIPMVITMVSEVVLLLGTASLIGWNIDLAAIAGIIIAVGTGVDHQIIIADEIVTKTKEYYANWKSRIKKAFFIIIAAYLTTFVAMLPLISAGAGLLRGFAITTILGVTYGVFVTRPAFAAMMEIFSKE